MRNHFEKIRIVAVGSNDLLAYEIRYALDQIFGESASVETCVYTGQKIREKGDFYACNITIYEEIQDQVEKEKLLMMNLTPDLSFFMKIAGIDPKEKVYLYNNKMSYIKRLIMQLEAVGLPRDRFVPIAYEEEPASDVERKLGEARYIAGVDLLLKRLESREKNFCMIPAKRYITSDCGKDILNKISVFYKERLNDALFSAKKEFNEMMNNPAVQYECCFGQLSDRLGKIAEECGRISSMIQSIIVKTASAQLSIDLTRTDPGNDDFKRMLSYIRNWKDGGS